LEFPQKEVSTIINLGTGVSSIKLGKGLVSVAKACSKIATDTEKRAEDFVETYCKVGGLYRGKYHRFNVTRAFRK